MKEDFSEFEGMTAFRAKHKWLRIFNTRGKDSRKLADAFRQKWNRYIMFIHLRPVPSQEEAYRDANPLLYESLSKRRGGKSIMIPPPDPPPHPW